MGMKVIGQKLPHGESVEVPPSCRLPPESLLEHRRKEVLVYHEHTQENFTQTSFRGNWLKYGVLGQWNTMEL
jgi:hypothetical protein